MPNSSISLYSDAELVAQKAIDLLLKKNDLPYELAYEVVSVMLTNSISDVKVATILALLSAKSESIDEIMGFLDGMKSHATPIEGINCSTIDIVGTGGDKSSSVNISTMAAIVMSAAGVNVLKHGNRASSSQSGSADVLEALGIKIDLNSQNVANCVNNIGIGFAFAPIFHSAMRFVGPVRKEMKIPTIFNLLGPLSNPSHYGNHHAKAVIGVANKKYASLLAQVMSNHNVDGFVFNGEDEDGNFIDELASTIHGSLFEMKKQQIYETNFNPKMLANLLSDKGVILEQINIAELKGGTPQNNATVAKNIFKGVGSNPNDDRKYRAIFQTVCLNAAAGIVADGNLLPNNDSDIIDRFAQGYQIALECIMNGSVSKKLKIWIEYSNDIGNNPNS